MARTDSLLVFQIYFYSKFVLESELSRIQFAYCRKNAVTYSLAVQNVVFLQLDQK